MPTKKTSEADLDDLRPEYDFRSLRVVARGSARVAQRVKTIQLEPDVAAAFPDSDSVNEALRLLLKLANQQVRLAH